MQAQASAICSEVFFAIFWMAAWSGLPEELADGLTHAVSGTVFYQPGQIPEPGSLTLTASTLLDTSIR